MKLHCQENKRGRNENLCFSDRKKQEFGGRAASRRVSGSKFEVPSSKLRACSNPEPRTSSPELGASNAERQYARTKTTRTYTIGARRLAARKELQQKPFKIFRLGEMRKNRVIERLRQTLQYAHMPLRIDAGVDNHLQKHFTGNVV